MGEVVVAFVVSDTNSLDVDDVRKFVAERIAEFKVPAEFRFVDEIPRTGSGKVIRHQLRDRLQ